jgi:hypothetical protein
MTLYLRTYVCVYLCMHEFMNLSIYLFINSFNYLFINLFNLFIYLLIIHSDDCGRQAPWAAGGREPAQDPKP